jgi:hypothetical protein
MWSGPRNISTALMRSWENRADCAVVDEPFYACYLQESGLAHPCREQILQTQSSSRAQVIALLCEHDPGTELYYQKLMTHHMPSGTDMSWCTQMRHCFLIRDPAYIIASYLQKMPSVELADIGIVRQLELFNEIQELTGTPPAVLDSDDVLRDPGGVLGQLCTALDLEFRAGEMLRWPPGRRASDGVWANHWYQSVEASTGFAPWQARHVKLTPGQQALADQMQGVYQQLARHRIKPRLAAD